MTPLVVDPDQPARTLRSLAVYLGSSTGADPRLVVQAAELGARLGREGIELVFGGSQVGLMGVLADACLSAGGTVTGVTTKRLVDAEVAHHGLSELIVVDTMHERKLAMNERADAFVMLPGGIGTLDEFLEAMTWLQLGIHEKPCAVLDSTGFYEPLLAQLDRAVEQRMLRAANRSLLIEASTVDELLVALRGWQAPPPGPKWMDRPPAP